MGVGLSTPPTGRGTPWLAPGRLSTVVTVSSSTIAQTGPVDGRAGRPGADRSPVRAVLTAPFSARTWLCTIHLVLGLPLGLTTFVVLVTLLPLTVGLIPTVVGAMICGLLLLWCVRAFTAVQRSRFAEILRVDIPRQPRGHQGTFWRRSLAEFRDPGTWRQVGYHLLALPIGVLGLIVVYAGWSVGIAWTLAPLYRSLLPEKGVLGIPMRDWRIVLVVTVIGVVVLLVTPWLTQAIAGLDALAARSLLGPSRTEALTRRVQSLSQSRAGAVDAADAERRRIERDLHDGTQQRLVSLAMNLGMAREELTDLPEPAREAIASAHDEAKQALSELRDFVRGLHPAVLNDRGLDAALSGITARSPVPVRLTVNVPERCSPTIEAIAYFVVSEALTNTAKHAQATGAQVTVERSGDRLRIVVGDDGRGGATVDRGSGLLGLAQRVASVDGHLILDSPVGGPTIIAVELPCES